MSSDPDEAKVVANAIARQLGIRGGCINPTNIDNIARVAPRMYHELMEDAEIILADLETHRRGRK